MWYSEDGLYFFRIKKLTCKQFIVYVPMENIKFYNYNIIYQANKHTKKYFLYLKFKMHTVMLKDTVLKKTVVDSNFWNILLTRFTYREIRCLHTLFNSFYSKPGTFAYLPPVTNCLGFPPWKLPNGNFESAILSLILNKTVNHIGFSMYGEAKKQHLKVSQDYKSHLARKTRMDILKSWQEFLW